MTVATMIRPDTINLERVGDVLRAHGLNVYLQGNELVAYAASTNRWQEVYRFTTCPGRTEQEVANFIAHKIADLVAGPHTHD